MTNSDLELLNCSDFGDFKWVRKYSTPTRLHQFFPFFQSDFSGGDICHFV